MTKEELENYQEKVRDGNFLSLKLRAADELMTTITKLRFSKEKDIKGLLQNNIKN